MVRAKLFKSPDGWYPFPPECVWVVLKTFTMGIVGTAYETFDEARASLSR